MCGLEKVRTNHSCCGPEDNFANQSQHVAHKSTASLRKANGLQLTAADLSAVNLTAEGFPAGVFLLISVRKLRPQMTEAGRTCVYVCEIKFGDV